MLGQSSPNQIHSLQFPERCKMIDGIEQLSGIETARDNVLRRIHPCRAPISDKRRTVSLDKALPAARRLSEPFSNGMALPDKVALCANFQNRNQPR